MKIKLFLLVLFCVIILSCPNPIVEKLLEPFDREKPEEQTCDHDWGSWTETTAPTCTVAGLETRTCLHNATHIQTQTISALGHELGDMETGVAPTCTEQGGNIIRCIRYAVCGHYVVDGIPIPALGHDFTDFVSTTLRTCTTSGYDIYKCVRCIETEQQNPDPALGHTPGTAADCTTPQTCTTCGVVLVPATGHTPSSAATCTTNQICTVCNALIVSALGHDHTGAWKVNNSDHWKECLRCGIIDNEENHNFVNDVCTECSASDVMANLANTWANENNPDRIWIISNDSIRYENNDSSGSGTGWWQVVGGTWEAVSPTGTYSSDYPLGLKFEGGTRTNYNQGWGEPVHFFFSLDMSEMKAVGASTLITSSHPTFIKQ